jgi:hypothetical protein
LTVIGIVQMRPLLAVLGVLPAMISFARLQLAHFSAGATALSIFGLPMFSYLLVRSQRLHAQRRVTWKGREYSGQGTEVNPGPQLGV